MRVYYGKKFSSKSAFCEKNKNDVLKNDAIFLEKISAMHGRTVLQSQFALIILLCIIRFHGMKFLALGQVQKSFESP